MKNPAAAGFVSSDRFGDPLPHRALGLPGARTRGGLRAFCLGLLAIAALGVARVRVLQQFPLESVAHGALLGTTWKIHPTPVERNPRGARRPRAVNEVRAAQ